MTPPVDVAALRETVSRIVSQTPILDIHTHLYPPTFGELLLWGVDELLNYHYLVAEVYRVAPMPYEQFWAMTAAQRADHIWKHLFIERSPVSEACRGVLTVLNALGIDVGKRDLGLARKYFSAMKAEDYVDKVLELSNVKSVIMTNDPFDPVERACWERKAAIDPRFQAVLRIDPLLEEWPSTAPRLREWGYDVTGDLGANDLEAARKFLRDWVKRMNPRYMAVSLGPGFAFPEDSPRAKLIEHAVIPVTREAGIPFAMMIGVRRKINPGLRAGSDGVGKADVTAVENLCRQFPDNRFLVTMLSRENQHELCVSARKLSNLMIFGCWWFLNNPSIIEEMTRERFELLGLSFTPQHSDARVLDQLVYKWAHSRAIIADVLTDKYADIARTGWVVSERDMRRDVEMLLGGNFEGFCAGASKATR